MPKRKISSAVDSDFVEECNEKRVAGSDETKCKTKCSKYHESETTREKVKEYARSRYRNLAREQKADLLKKKRDAYHAKKAAKALQQGQSAVPKTEGVNLSQNE